MPSSQIDEKTLSTRYDRLGDARYGFIASNTEKWRSEPRPAPVQADGASMVDADSFNPEGALEGEVTAASPPCG